jgi:hypothetical protein
MLSREELERLASVSPECRRIYQEIIELEQNYQRCRELEERTRIRPPPRQASPPPPKPPPEPPRVEGKGFSTPTPLGPPPGVALCDRLMDAQDARDRQALIDAEIRRRLK